MTAGPFKGVPIKIKLSFTRDQLRDDLREDRPLVNRATPAGRVMRAMTEAGIPMVGVLGIIGVAYGELHIHMIYGLEGDEFVYEWEGVPVPKHLRHYQLTTSFTLDDAIADFEEL